MSDHPAAKAEGPSPEAVRQQLRAILAGRPFATALRARRFLTHIVEETLADRTEGIKELILGIEVFDRPADFDPKSDTIVRVEAGRLRKRLAEYYADEGAAADLRIEVPLGSYVPQFQLRPQSQPDSARAAVPHVRAAAAAVALLAIAGLAWLAVGRLRAPTPNAIPSVAVLPFLNLTADPANEYFTDGLSEELTDALCNAGGLRVAARTSAFSFKGKSSDVHEIAAKLHVAYVVEGSVRKQGEQLKVTAQLIRTDDGYHVWSGSIERKLSDVFKVQQELAGSLVAALQLKMTGSQSRRLRKTHTANQQAFDLYLRGKHAMNLLRPGSARQAEELFRQSIAADPVYALSYMGLAEAYALENGYNASPELALRLDEAVHKALALDDELADGYSMLGTMAAVHDRDWVAAERLFRKALELNPSLAVAHNDLAQSVLAPQGRWREAAAENRRASELDPTNIRNALADFWLAILQRRYEAGIVGLRTVAAENPKSPLPMFFLAQALLGKGDYRGALEIAQEMERGAPNHPMLAFIGHVQTLMGNRAEARATLEQLLAISQPGRAASPFSLSLIYIGLGDSDTAFRYLEMAREQHEFYLNYARVHFVFDPFRSDRRFLTLLRELGLSDEQIPKNQ